MNLNNKYDLCIIIPAYNAKETIDKTLTSIKIQKLSISFEVIIVNDSSEYDYKDFVNKYKKHYNIREIKTEVNSGPGVARQLGMDNSNSKYIVFIDSDDNFYDENSISNLYNEIEKSKSDLAIGNFIYQRDNIETVKKKNPVWLHGKIYKRNFLEMNKIYFNDTRSNEDTGFNRLTFFLNPKIYFLDKIVYVYKENPNSITRRNNRDYKFKGIEGFCFNMNWAMDQALKRGIGAEKIGDFALDVLMTLYIYYIGYQKEYDVEKIMSWGNEIKKKYNMYNESKTFLDLLDRKKEIFKEEFSNDYSYLTFEDFLDKFEN